MLADTPYRMIDGSMLNFKQYIRSNKPTGGKQLGRNCVFSGRQCDGVHGGAVCIPRYSLCMRQNAGKLAVR